MEFNNGNFCNDNYDTDKMIKILQNNQNFKVAYCDFVGMHINDDPELIIHNPRTFEIFYNGWESAMNCIVSPCMEFDCEFKSICNLNIPNSSDCINFRKPKIKEYECLTVYKLATCNSNNCKNCNVCGDYK